MLIRQDTFDAHYQDALRYELWGWKRMLTMTDGGVYTHIRMELQA